MRVNVLITWAVLATLVAAGSADELEGEAARAARAARATRAARAARGTPLGGSGTFGEATLMRGALNILECTASGTFPLLTEVNLIDVSTLQNEVLPAGALVTSISAHAETEFAGLATLSIGWAGSSGALVATTDGLTAGGLNAADWRKSPATFSAPTAAQTLVVTATGLATTGEIRVKIYYETFD